MARRDHASAAGLIALALLAACGRGGAPPGPRSAVLITLDTTRADALSFAGGPPGITPNLDALARESVRYASARTVTPLTLPAHASMLTGLYPPRTGVRSNGPVPLPRSATTLAERAQVSGVQTAAFVASAALDRAFGLTQGFAVYDEPSNTGTGGEPERSAEEVVGAARAWFARHREPGQPFFLWVHLFDAHAPYAPSPRLLARAGGSAYHGEVAAMDAALGGLLNDLRAAGELSRAVVVVAGDHGEGLGDNGEATHGVYCYEATLRVPLLVRHPDGARAGETSDEIVTVADVYPTLLEAMGLGTAGDVDGVSLWSGRVPLERGVYFESYSGWASFGWAPLAGWVDREGKYVHSSTPTLRPVPETLSDEGIAALPAAGAEAEHYRRAIADAVARPALLPDGSAVVEEATLAQLAALGYATTDDWTTAPPHPLEPADLPDPHDRKEVLEVTWRASDALYRGERATAVALLEEALAADPKNPHVLDLLATQVILGGDCARALELLLTRLRVPPERIRTHEQLSECCAALGQEGRALLHRRRALELRIKAHDRRGEPSEAARLRAILEAGD